MDFKICSGSFESPVHGEVFTWTRDKIVPRAIATILDHSTNVNSTRLFKEFQIGNNLQMIYHIHVQCVGSPVELALAFWRGQLYSVKSFNDSPIKVYLTRYYEFGSCDGADRAAFRRRICWQSLTWQIRCVISLTECSG